MLRINLQLFGRRGNMSGRQTGKSNGSGSALSKSKLEKDITANAGRRLGYNLKGHVSVEGNKVIIDRPKNGSLQERENFGFDVLDYFMSSAPQYRFRGSGGTTGKMIFEKR